MPGQWHNKMENKFPSNMREVKFYCSTKMTNTCRRADICLNNNRTCEIQHSYISEQEIVERFNDWNKFGKEIIWLVDGNKGVQIEKLSTCNYLIIFKDIWKYKSFLKTYDFILLERENQVFKVELNKIKSGMIELKESKTLEETIFYLKRKPDRIWEFWSEDNVIKSVLSVYQQGAGNGKTYGIWKSITENIDKKTYIIITKQHSAKNVIYEELKDQKIRFKNGEEIYHIENLTNEAEENTEKHFVIKYTHKNSGRECKVIIGTIDSFCYNLSHSNAKGSNYFKGIVDNIKDKGATKIRNGYMHYGGQYIQLSKESEIWVDEVQDLPENYLHALLKLMYETSCYMSVVGDKLQSLEYNKNFLTNVMEEGLPNIKVNINEAMNKNRRIKVTNMDDGINKLVQFNKYDLPFIQCDPEIPKEINEEPIRIIEQPFISQYTSEQEVSIFCDEIMKYYVDEIEKNNYLPKDFLFIFPIMKSNLIAPELQTKIQEYWSNKYDNKYRQYVFLHKHTEGVIINTKDSVDATRIMSIRSSKGDGRKVVFVLSITETSLKLLSNKERGLVYESHLHVALTRAKNQIYFGLTKNYDDIHFRFGKNVYTENMNNMNKKIQIEKASEILNKNNMIHMLDTNGIQFKSTDEIKMDQSEIVDWGYHCIKYHTFYYNVILKIINNNPKISNNPKSQIFQILKNISNYSIRKLCVKDYYTFLNKYQYKPLPEFPLCIISSKEEYKKYYEIIETTMTRIQEKIKANELNGLNVYDSIILTYMIQIVISQKYTDMSPMDLYSITDFFHFKQVNKEQYLLNNILNIKSIIDKSGIQCYKNVNWHILKHIELDSKYEYFKISKLQFPIIGNNETHVIHIVLESNLTQLNFWDIMIKVLLERFLIYNPKSTKDQTIYKNKNINTYLFLLNTNSFVKIDWRWDKQMDLNIRNDFKTELETHFQSNHSHIFSYFNNLIQKNVESWENEPDKLIDNEIHSMKKTNCPDYIINVFEDINTKIEDEDDYDYINKFETFNNKLNKKLHLYLKKYLML